MKGNEKGEEEAAEGGKAANTRPNVQYLRTGGRFKSVEEVFEGKPPPAYRLSDIAKLYNININTLRSWKRRGKLAPPDAEIVTPAWKERTVLRMMDELLEGEEVEDE